MRSRGAVAAVVAARGVEQQEQAILLFVPVSANWGSTGEAIGNAVRSMPLLRWRGDILHDGVTLEPVR